MEALEFPLDERAIIPRKNIKFGFRHPDVLQSEQK